MKKRRFAEGGGTSVDEDPIRGMADFYSQSGSESSPSVAESLSDTEEVVAPKKQSFKEAFASARDSGKKTFEWNGKQYSTKMASAPAAKEAASTAAGDFQRADKAPPKLKYQSLQDRAADYAAARKESGVGMYGTRKASSEPRGVMRVERDKMEPQTGMGTSYKPKMRGGETFAKGGSIQKYAKGGTVRGWGMARGARAAKIV